MSTAFATALQATVKDQGSNPVSGVVVTFTAPASGASGKFGSGATTATTNSSGVATATAFTANATAGTYRVTATVAGVATPASFSLTNTQPGLHPTTTKVVTSGSPSLIDQDFVIFTATVESTYGPIPNGETVTFYDGGIAIGTGTAAGGSATFQTSALTARTHTIKASYSGDATFKASSGTVTQVVNLYASTIKVYTQPNPSTFGQVVGLIAVVTSGEPGSPTGTVTFKNGGTVVGTGVLVPVAGSDPAKSVATFPTQPKQLSAGTVTITATYNGDALSGKASGTTTHTVNQATTTASVKSSVNPSTLGQTVKLTATVTSINHHPNRDGDFHGRHHGARDSDAVRGKCDARNIDSHRRFSQHHSGVWGNR